MPDTNDTEDIGQGSQSESSKDKGMLKKFLNPGMWTCIFTGVLMVFSGLLYIVSNKANETSVATQRAFISFSGPGFVKITNGKKLRGVNILYAMSNSGTTPARSGVSEWNLSLGPTAPQRGLDFDKLPQSERLSIVLGPKANFQLTPIAISMEDLEAVGAGKKHLFFWGWTTYRDIFSGTPVRLSEFCTDITGITWAKADHTDAMGDINTSNPPCPTHNCYDEDCEDYSRRIQ
jgi:hypothetical protein